MSIAHINGIDVFYRTDGNPKKPALIFSNSLGTDHTMWNSQMKDLMNDFYLIRYDTRGHGMSSAPKGPYSIELLAKDVLGLLDYLRIEKATFCGISMGGLIGQWLAAHMPDRIEKLVIANTASKIGTEVAWNDRAAAVRKEGLNAIAESAPARWFTPEFYGECPAIVNSLVVNLKNQSSEGYASCCEALANEDLSERCATIKHKTLIIGGMKDPVTTLDDANQMNEKIKNSTLKQLNASHISNIEAANEFTQSIKVFLSNE